MKQFRVGWYEFRTEQYQYFDDELEARNFWIGKRQENEGTETWYDKLIEGNEYETIESYYPEEDDLEDGLWDDISDYKQEFIDLFKRDNDENI